VLFDVAPDRLGVIAENRDSHPSDPIGQTGPVRDHSEARGTGTPRAEA
jgi:hypothetical protein